MDLISGPSADRRARESTEIPCDRPTATGGDGSLAGSAFWASSPYRRPAWRRRPPSSSPGCPGPVSHPVPGRRRPPGLTRTCPAAKPATPTDATDDDRRTACRSAVWVHRELVRRARRPVRRWDRSSHQPFAVLPGSDQRRPPPDLPLRAQVRLLRHHRRPRSSSAGKGLFVNLHGESRFGQSVNRDAGSLIPANFALEFPKPTGSASALTNVQIEQFLGPDFVVTFGKLNAADGVNIHPFLGGNGINRFMNEAFVLSPIYGRTDPLLNPGRRLQLPPGISTRSSPSSSSIRAAAPIRAGLSQMFSNGATLFASAFACP